MLYQRGGRRPITGGNDHWTKLLVPSDGANGTIVFADRSVGGKYGAQHSVARNGNTVMTNAVALQGRATSILFDGSGDDLTVANHADFHLSDHDFTLDFAYRAASIPGAATSGRGVIGNYDDATKTGFYMWQDNVNGSLGAGSLYFYVGDGVTNYATYCDGIAAGVTRHLAIVRRATALAFYKDGVLYHSTALPAGMKVATPVRNLTIGRAPGGIANTNADWNGYLGEIRLSVGQPRWLANFTPPASYWKSWE